MISKIFFAVAIIMAVCWIILFLIFNTFPYIHIVAIISIILFIASYTTNNAKD